MSIGFVILLLVILTFVFILAGIPIYISLLFTGSLSLVALGLSTDCNYCRGELYLYRCR